MCRNSIEQPDFAYAEGPFSKLICCAKASNALLAGVVREQGLHCPVYPDSFWDDVNSDFRPEDSELQNCFFDVLFEAPRIAVILGKLLAETYPRDDRFALCAVAAVDKKGEQILQLWASFLPLELHP